MLYALLVLLALDATPTRLSWHSSEDECQRLAAMEASHRTLIGHPPTYVGCIGVSHQLPLLPAR
jgi:hypothetical protein